MARPERAGEDVEGPLVEGLGLARAPEVVDDAAEVGEEGRDLAVLGAEAALGDREGVAEELLAVGVPAGVLAEDAVAVEHRGVLDGGRAERGFDGGERLLEELLRLFEVAPRAAHLGEVRRGEGAERRLIRGPRRRLLEHAARDALGLAERIPPERIHRAQEELRQLLARRHPAVGRSPAHLPVPH
jgi:hypothetical protein